MKIYGIDAPEFAEFGKVLEGYDTAPLIDALNNSTPLPEGTAYVAEEPALQSLDAAKVLAPSLYGGLPVQFGWCNGHNTKLNCLEYHRDSEINIGSDDFVLLLAKRDEIEDGMLDTSKVKAFLVPAGTVIEVFATTLHFAPCHTDERKGFRVAVALPLGTNTEKPEIEEISFEDGLLWARNKWLLAHPDSAQAKKGAYIGLRGENIDISK